MFPPECDADRWMSWHPLTIRTRISEPLCFAWRHVLWGKSAAIQTENKVKMSDISHTECGKGNLWDIPGTCLIFDPFLSNRAHTGWLPAQTTSKATKEIIVAVPISHKNKDREGLMFSLLQIACCEQYLTQCAEVLSSTELHDEEMIEPEKILLLFLSRLIFSSHQ